MLFLIAIGTNLGDRLGNLHRGLTLLHQRVQPLSLRAGGLYETAPVDCAPGTQAFLNSVIEIEVSFSAWDLHTELQSIEQALGRPSVREKNSPRPLDLDLLLAGDFVSDDPVLTVPHPRLHLRRFVLQPLADLCPALVPPGHKNSIQQYLEALSGDPAEVRLVEKDWMKPL